MTRPVVRTETAGAVYTIILDRPERRNAVDRQTADALRCAFEDFEADESLSVAVLWGDGGVFCAGADLSAMADPETRNTVTVDGDRKSGSAGMPKRATPSPSMAAAPVPWARPGCSFASP